MRVRTVYAIKHNVTGRIYIGSSERVKWRIREHLQVLRNHKCKNPLMQKDFDEHGEDYSFKKLDVIRDLKEGWKEYFWMMYFRTTDEEYGYNYRDPHVKRKTIEDFGNVLVD